jgi:integrase/recombinase XerD
MDKWPADKFVHQIDERVIDDIVKERIKTAGVATVRRDLDALSSLLAYAKQKGLCATNPAAERLENLGGRRDPVVLPNPMMLIA